MHVLLSILEDDTLAWDYKLNRLIKPKDFKQATQLIDMLIAQLHHPTTLQAAHRLRGSWSELSYVHSKALRDLKQPKESILTSLRSRIFDNVSLLLEGIKTESEQE
jgi:mRNA-degrading endonuclease YafQ of YafQ-DinJ toxin-antitoxin module